jgi:argininosuccinate synthase
VWNHAVDGSTTPPDDVFVLTRAARVCPDEPAIVEVSFDRGTPTAVNGVPMRLLDLVQSLNTIAGTHGVGRLELVNPDGNDSRTHISCEAPAAVVLAIAHEDLQHFVSTTEVNGFVTEVRQHYAELIQRGQWHGQFRPALAAFVEAVQQRVTGTVRIELLKGHCEVIGRTSPHANETPVVQPVGVEQATAQLPRAERVPVGESWDA